MTTVSKRFLTRQNRPTERPDGKRGSALLITLLVVSLMMIVVLSFVVFVRIELRTITNRQELLQARSNARLAGNLAIARLQELAGADTRVTSPIQNPSSPNNRFVGQVIDAASYIPDGSGGLALNADYAQNLGYLLSGDFDPLSDTMFASPGVPEADFAILVGDGSVNDEDEYVAAPLEEFVDNSGAFA